eukprot:TRINITY_DN1196_c0_g1_i1.p1 TRINITY_DN1196_c0_g1~~TRINITY_DN1196_c0_g1_i1.p1  ORF type:complete len:293 (-),score=65.45 TRINITY_DN1196_c0_g1_i1:434-1312(-)
MAPGEKMMWGDSEDIEDDIDGLLPPVTVIGPDANGIKTYIEYRKNDDDVKVKVTKKVRVKRQMKKLNKNVIRRRQLKKFGDAFGQNSNENLTLVSVEEIFLERTRPVGSKQEEAKPAITDGIPGNTSLIVCRICGKKGDHWTSKCPYRDIAKDIKGFAIGEKAPEEGDPDRPLPAAGTSGKSSYIPPSLRSGATRSEGDSMRQRGRDDNSIRVTNLSEDTREADLQELFRPFGHISRIYIAYDKETHLSRGFAFINFVNREDAIRAIKKLDGYGYDSLILRVEWATPRADRS